MSYRIKYWYMLCGGNVLLTLIAASGHLLTLTLLGVFLTRMCWCMAEYFLNKELDKQEDEL